MKRIAIIPARGGSKRLTRKNILPINGRPILTYPIATVLESSLFEEVLVSTEDEEIAGIAVEAGAKVIHRPKELAEDQSTVVQVCSHVLSLAEYTNVEMFCCVYATAVSLLATDLSKSLNLLDEEPVADFVMGVSSYQHHPVQALSKTGDYLQMMWPEYKGIQSQHYPELVVSNGTFYWARGDAFVSEQSFYGTRLKGYLIPRERAIDINTYGEYQEAISRLSSM